MAITLRGNTSSTSNNTAQTSFATSYSGWTTANPATGDIVLIVGLGINANLTFSQSAGTGSYTFISTGDNNSGSTGFTTFAAYRVLQAGDTAPTFTISSSSKWSYAMIAFTPDAGQVISFDANSTTQINTTAATSFTPNAATAAGTGEVSLILNTAWESATGANTITVTAPTNWTGLTGAGFGGGASTKSNLAQVCYRIGVGSGSVAPGSETIVAGASTTVFSNIYHVLVKEAANNINVSGVVANITVASTEGLTITIPGTVANITVSGQADNIGTISVSVNNADIPVVAPAGSVDIPISINVGAAFISAMIRRRRSDYGNKPATK